MSWLEFWFLVVLFFLIFLSLGLSGFVEHRKLEQAEDYFEHDACFIKNKTQWSAYGRFGRGIRLHNMSLVLMMPAFSRQYRLIESDELPLMPKALMRWIIWSACFSWFVILYFIVCAVWVYSKY